MRTNTIIQRELLAAAILHVRSGRADSRISLVPALGLARSTVGVYVDQLISEGYIHEFGFVQGPIGRPKRKLSALPDAGWFAGVEFNAERVQAVRIDFAGKRVAAQAKMLPEDLTVRVVLQAVQSAIAALAKGTASPLLAIGVGAPGVVDPRSGISSRYPFIPEWHHVPLAETLHEQFDVPITVENNLRAIALAERWFGGGRDLDHYVILGPRAGFGIATVQNGQLARGVRHAAGEIGHWPWPVGNREGRELQDALSALAVWRRLAGVSGRAKVPEDLRAALAEFSDATGAAWNEVVADFGHIVGLLELLIDTEVFFLHGPLNALGNRFCHAVEQSARASTPALASEPLRVAPSTLGDDAGALGAASMAMEAWVPAQPI